MSTMRFSILIPVYNTSAFLCECLDSVVAQTCTDFEAVVVNDGSTDHSGSMLDEYAAAHPDIFRVIHKENGGLISARRAAIAQARGEYCVFLDSDDYLDANTLEEISGSIDATGADMVIYRIRKHFPDKVVDQDSLYEDGTVFSGEDKRDIYARLIGTNGLNSLCMKAIRTELLRGDPTDYSSERNPRGEDKFQTLYPITNAQKVAYLDRVLYNCRVNSSSITRQVSVDSADELFNRSCLELQRSMITRWGMEQPQYLERFYVWQLVEVIDFFSACFISAGSEKERRRVFEYDWFALLTPGYEPYLDSKCERLTKSKRMRLKWLRDGRYHLMKAVYMLSRAKRV